MESRQGLGEFKHDMSNIRTSTYFAKKSEMRLVGCQLKVSNFAQNCIRFVVCGDLRTIYKILQEMRWFCKFCETVKSAEAEQKVVRLAHFARVGIAAIFTSSTHIHSITTCGVQRNCPLVGVLQHCRCTQTQLSSIHMQGVQGILDFLQNPNCRA